ncbi:hypothetical protein AA313_de0207101 [Arthrobotrys entomopaga]|nr:hypothetical protein AA313_de0207101 [Arthrobotrys entomopaga]
MPPQRNRNTPSQPLLDSRPPAYSTFDTHSQRVFCDSNYRQPAPQVQVDAEIEQLHLQRIIELYRIFRYAIVAIAFVICLTVSLPFIFNEHNCGKHNDQYKHNNTGTVIPPDLSRPSRFNDPPQAGSKYIITEFTTNLALTYSDGSVYLAGYRKTPSQHWTVREQDGWLGFTVAPSESIRYLGFSAWPHGPTMRCSATEHRFNEMFAVVKREGAGFRVYLRDGDKLKPMGKDQDGNLARVEVSDIWWGFTKVGS